MSAMKKRGVDFSAIAARQMGRDVAEAAKGPDRFDRAQAALTGSSSTLEVDEIVARQESTREIDQGHVRTLSESIAALGLIEPVVVDSAKRLLAGGHRLDAIKLLRAEQPSVFAKWFSGGVPVRAMDFDADSVPARALEVEVAENEHRRDYTSAQVRELAARLRAAGYRDTVGRPKTGERALGPALGVVVGKSMKTIRKILADETLEGEGGAVKAEPVLPVVRALRVLTRQRELLPEPLVNEFDAFLAKLREAAQAAEQAPRAASVTLTRAQPRGQEMPL